jgi:hypothetical protein
MCLSALPSFRVPPSPRSSRLKSFKSFYHPALRDLFYRSAYAELVRNGQHTLLRLKLGSVLLTPRCSWSRFFVDH